MCGIQAVIPYVKRFSEAVSRIFTKFGVSVASKPFKTIKHRHSCTLVVYSFRKAIKYFTPSPVVVVVVGSVVVVAVVVVSSKTQECL